METLQTKTVGKSRYEKRAYCTKEGVWFKRSAILWIDGVAHCPICRRKVRVQGRKHFQRMEMIKQIGDQK